MEVEVDLSIIKRNAKIIKDQNYRFRSYLKGKDPDRIDDIVHELNERVMDHIDCTECANCCIELDISFQMDEINLLTNYLILTRMNL